ncbi:MAG: right-handed parallel beta-helix repeat-containing protein [Verrucomicrobiota bacterium JB023]|nr:right-handed parallel beta-helix repeat-containing protein [Verrucomicrobiota bacterium JB023]
MKDSPAMTYDEAAKILGLKKGETVENYRKAFDEVRKHMARLRDEADSAEKKENYQQELARFEEALAVASQHGPKKSRVLQVVLTLLVLGGLGTAAAFFLPQVIDENKARTQAAALIPAGDKALEAHDWVKAKQIFNEALALYPKSEAAKNGLAKIEQGLETERSMKVGFIVGIAQGLMEENRWESAEKQLKLAMEMDPDNEQLLSMQARMEEGKRVAAVETLVEEIEQARREEQWEIVLEKVDQLEELDPDNAELPAFREARAEAEVILTEYAKEARMLYEQASARDQGEYDEEALELLREAQRISPSAAASELYRKMSTYARTVKVPEEFESITEALAKVKAGDTIYIAEGTYEERLLVPSGVILEGTEGKTVISTPATEGSAAVVTGEGEAARLVRLVFRQTGLTDEEERYPVVLIQGGNALMEDCQVEFASGHGVAVTDGGELEMIGSEVRGSSWDGVAVVGEGSLAVLNDSRLIGNMNHGLDVWDGGRASLERSRFQENTLTGVFVTSADSSVELDGCSLERNREVGLVVADGASAEFKGGLIASNLLGGVFARDEGTTLSLFSNKIEKNGEAGLVVGGGAVLTKEEDNEMSENSGREKWLDADLTKVEERPIIKALPVEE